MKTVVLGLTLLLFIPSIQSVFAQEFKTYTDTQNRFTIQYADTWEWTTKEIGTEAVRFAPSGTMDKDYNLRPNIAIVIEPAESYLDTTDMKVKLKPPQTYGENIVSFMGEKPVRSTPINVTGADLAWKVEYTHSAPAYNGERYLIQVDAIKAKERCMIELSAPSLEMPENLPIFQKMIDSFTIS